MHYGLNRCMQCKLIFVYAHFVNHKTGNRSQNCEKRTTLSNKIISVLLFIEVVAGLYVQYIGVGLTLFNQGGYCPKASVFIMAITDIFPDYNSFCFTLVNRELIM